MSAVSVRRSAATASRHHRSWLGPDPVQLTGLVQPLDAVLADRLQRPVPGRLAALDDEQAVLGEAGQPVGDLRALAAGPRDRAGASTSNHDANTATPAQQRAIIGREQVVAPADGLRAASRAGRLARVPAVRNRSRWSRPDSNPSRPSAGNRAAASSMASAMPSSARHSAATRAASGGAASPVAAATRAANRSTASPPPPTTDSPGTTYTRSYGRRSRVRLVASTVTSGQPAMIRSTHARTPSSTCSQLSRTSSASLSGERGDQREVDRRGPLLGNADRLGDRRGDHRRVRHVDQVHEPHAVAAGRGEVGGDAQREPGLADAARTGRGDQAVLGERRGQRRPLGGATDERRDRHGQPAPAGLDQKARHGLGVPGQAAAIGELQLPQHRRHVALDGALRDEQRLGDLRVRQVPGDQGEDLGLPRRHPGALAGPTGRHAAQCRLPPRRSR